MGSFEKHRDFVERYDRSTPPYDDISDEEALDRYREAVAGRSEEDFMTRPRRRFRGCRPRSARRSAFSLGTNRTSGTSAFRARAHKRSVSRTRNYWLA